MIVAALAFIYFCKMWSKKKHVCIQIHLSFLDTVYFLNLDLLNCVLYDNHALNWRLWCMPVCNIISTQFIPQKGEIGLKLLFYWHLCAQNEVGLTFASTSIQLLVLLLLPAAFLLVVEEMQVIGAVKLWGGSWISAIVRILSICDRDNGRCWICLKMWQLPGLNISKYVRKFIWMFDV